MKKIVFASTVIRDDQVWLDGFRRALPDHDIIPWQADGESTGANLAIVWNPPSALLEREPQIKAMFNLAAGVDALMALPGLSAQIALYRLEDAGMASQMAEYALYYLLQQSRHFARYVEQQKQRTWDPLSLLCRADWPVGVLGMGLMGQHVARTIAQFGYPVAGWSRSAKTLPGIECFHGQKGLAAFLARTRVLINLLPLTDDTRGILGRDLFSQLLPESLVINLGRGGHLVEQELIPALDDGLLHGATLDVFDAEPLPADHPFWADSRITITPHVAANTLPQDSIEQMSAKIRQYVAGQEPSGRVRMDRGY